MKEDVAMRPSANGPPPVALEIERRAAAGSTERVRGRSVVIARPWAWLWWPSTPGLVRENPDVTDQRADSPRSISTVEVDWFLIFHAVRKAIFTLPATAAGRLAIERHETTIPFPLSDAEAEIVQSWVGENSPVMVDYTDYTTVLADPDLGVPHEDENGVDPEPVEIRDGRHRLWLSRPHQYGHEIPVMAECLYYLQEARDGHVPAQVVADSVEAASWSWPRRRSAARLDDPLHPELLARAHLELTTPAPVTPRMFGELARRHDDHLEVLADLHRAGRVDRELLARELPRAWRFKRDEVFVDPQVVVELFRGMGGFTVDGTPRRRPRGRWTLFRGSAPRGRAGASWTTNPNVASYFAGQRHEHGQGDAGARVWRVEVSAERVLAAFDDERELIVDLAGLENTITPADPLAVQDRRTRRRTRRLWSSTTGDY